MGLPLFVVPKSPKEIVDSAEKSASLNRSSIRRLRAQRGHPRTHTLSSEARRRRMLGMAESGDGPSRVPPDEIPDHPALIQARAQRLFNEETERLSDALIFARQRVNTEPDGPLMPPVPESRDFNYEHRQRDLQRIYQHRDDLRRARARSRYTPPPRTGASRTSQNALPRALPWDSTRDRAESNPESANRGDILNQARDLQHTAEHPTGSVPSATSERLQPSTRDSVHDAMSGTSNRVYYIGDLPPATRAGAHAARSRNERTVSSQRISAAEGPRVNGLGDRERSLTPGVRGDWDTLQTGITPDPQQPSASSSFASSSAAATAAASQPVSAPSSSTTSSMPRHIGVESPIIGDCDLVSESSGTETDDDTFELAELNRASDLYFSRTYAEVTEGRNRNEHADRAEHDDMRRIILRLADTEDVPEDWWPGAGLTRTSRRR